MIAKSQPFGHTGAIGRLYSKFRIACVVEAMTEGFLMMFGNASRMELVGEL
jgi:hypothetical protein